MNCAGVGKLDIASGTGHAGPPGQYGPVIDINPNPVTRKGYIEFTSDGEKAVSVSLVSLNGYRRMLFSGKPPAGIHKIAINAEKFPAGFYLVEMTSGNRRIVSRLVICRI